MAFTFLVVVTCTVGMGLPINALDRSAGGPLFLVTIVLTACYFVFFGGRPRHAVIRLALRLRAECRAGSPLRLAAATLAS